MYCDEWNTRLYELEKVIGYRFKNKSLLNKALTHSSYANEHGVKSNERLEFLGDSVLGLAISDYLFNKYPDLPEGDLTKMRSTIVSEYSLATAAKEIELGDYLLLGRGEARTGGRNRDSILADAVEAIIGAIYIDKNYTAASMTVLALLKKQISIIADGTGIKDYKTELQEYIQSRSTKGIEYKIVDEKGPDHAKLFIVHALHEGRSLGEGRGRSKKEAEQNAAKGALESLTDGG